MNNFGAATGSRWLLVGLGLLIALIGLGLAGGGGYLVVLGGSWYFLLMGLAMLVSGVLIAKRRPQGAWLYAVALVLTAIWAVWDTGLEYWPLVSRVLTFAVIGLVVALIYPQLARASGSTPGRGAYGVAGLLGRLAQKGCRQQLAAQRGTQVAHLAPGIGQLRLRHFHVQLLAHGQETLGHLVLRRCLWCGCCRILGLHGGGAALLHAGAARHGRGGGRRFHGCCVMPLVAARKGQRGSQCQHGRQGHAGRQNGRPGMRHEFPLENRQEQAAVRTQSSRLKAQGLPPGPNMVSTSDCSSKMSDTV